MRFLVWVVILMTAAAAQAEENIFAFTPPPDTGLIETPYGPAPAIRDWRKDTPEALVRGIKAYDGEDYETAKKYLLPLVDAGHAVAQKYVGRMYDDPKGFTQNVKNACDLYEESANRGFRPSQFNLGTCFLTGSGRALDLEQSIMWLYPGAKIGHKFSRYKMSIAYYDKKDNEGYIYWLGKASESGSMKAKVLLRGYKDNRLTEDVGLLDYVCAIYASKSGKPYDYCDD